MIHFNEKGEAIHTTRDGVEIPLKEMSDTHLLNTLRYIERKARAGIIVIHPLNDIEDPYANAEYLYGEEVKDFFDYDYYKEEANRRGWVVW